MTTYLTAITIVTAHAQPVITAVVSAADSQPQVAYGGMGSIYGTSLSEGSPSQATSIPLPKKLNETEVMICGDPIVWERCQAAELLYVSPTLVNFVMPILSPGAEYSVRIAIKYKGVPDRQAAGGTSGLQVPAQVRQSAPRMFLMGYDCSIDLIRYPDGNSPCGLSWTQQDKRQPIRGAVTDLEGKVLTSANPARMGRDYSLWLTGLGRITNGRTASGTLNVVIADIPAFGYPFPTKMFGEVTYAGNTQFPGLNQLNFRLPSDLMGIRNSYPPMHPCGRYRLEISIGLSVDPRGSSWEGVNAQVQIPLVIEPGDVECIAQ